VDKELYHYHVQILRAEGVKLHLKVIQVAHRLEAVGLEEIQETVVVVVEEDDLGILAVVGVLVEVLVEVEVPAEILVGKKADHQEEEVKEELKEITEDLKEIAMGPKIKSLGLRELEEVVVSHLKAKVGKLPVIPTLGKNLNGLIQSAKLSFLILALQYLSDAPRLWHHPDRSCFAQLITSVIMVQELT
jgi:hypothetical protein